ncbi:MAG: FAD:protein FMN transferase [Planctomycetota bacterium]|jgi:thiamine biosynthesis lipoprotein
MQETKNRTIAYTVLTVIAMGGLLWLSTKNRGVTVDGGFRITMGTVARILVVAQNQPQADAAIDAAFDKIYDIERLMSDYDPNSQLSQVNREAFEHPVPVDAELFEILTAAKLYSCTSGGAFDVTIGPVVQLWRKAKDDYTAPTPEAIAKAKETAGYENLVLDAENKTVTFKKEGMFLDLGGIAKGYAIDKAVEILQSAGMQGAMVDIGGDLRCFGTPANGKKHWFIGLQDPQNEEDILLKLNMDNRAVATSGDYRRFVMLDDEKHSHIIDPATADSAAGLSSVTIIAPTAMAADALATAVTVLGNQKGLKLIETIDSTEAVLISHGDETSFQKTSGVDQYILKLTDHYKMTRPPLRKN